MKKLRYRYAFIILCVLLTALSIVAQLVFENFALSFVLAPLLSVVIMEMGLRYRSQDHNNRKFNFENVKEPFLRAHPYLPFVYKEDVFVPMLPRNEYDFMDQNCDFPKIKTNNRGHLNGPNGNRPVSLVYSENMLRVSTLGDSVSANYIRKDNRNYNFSVEIERQLAGIVGDKTIEVNNCAIGGYTLLDILVKFVIKDIHENPNVVVLNHGYSNIRSYLCKNYSTDNTHFRRSFSIGESRYKFASYIPFKNTLFYKTFFSPWLPNDLKDFLKFVSLDDFDIEAQWKGFDIFEVNLTNLINLSLVNHIKFVLCTCPHYLHSGIVHSKGHQKFHEGMKIQNEIIRDVAKKMSVYLVDNEKNVPASEEYFIDSIHLSPLGCEKSAAGVSDVIGRFL
jgi:hypothetical protein